MAVLRKTKRPTRNRIDMTGQWFGHWKAIGPHDCTDSGGNTYWRCVCACGRKSVSQGQNLRNGSSKSCGRCKSGAQNLSRQIGVWVARFSDPAHPEYREYGGAGRKCDSLLLDLKPDEIRDKLVSRIYGKRNGKPRYAAFEFERYLYDVVLVDPKGDLHLGNLAFRHRERPMRPKNRRCRLVNYMGREMSIAAFCRETGLHRTKVYRWLESGRTPDELLASIVTSHLLEQ